jgi:hypothetical protein
MRLAVLICFVIGCLVACDDGERRKEELESKYRELAKRCLAVGMQLGDAWQCLADAGATAQYYTYSDTIIECTGGGWFEGPEICGGIVIRYEWREDFPSSVITGWQVDARERTLQKGFAR